MEINDTKSELIALGPETLADTLLEASQQHDFVRDKIDQLISTPQENVKRFKKKLSSLKRSTRFISWRDIQEFTHELEMILQDLKVGIEDPDVGLELISAFYKTDNSVFERCDDSSGVVSYVYRYDAKNLFQEFAAHCNDKNKVANTILDLSLNNDYGVRDAVIECASTCLPETEIRTMIEKLQARITKDGNKYENRTILFLIESLAAQIKDAELFEQTRIAAWGDLNSAAYIDIARVYFDSGKNEIALEWLNKIPENETFRSYEKNKLLEEIYRKQGDTKQLTDLLHHKLESHPSTDNLNALLEVIGKDQSNAVITKLVNLILSEAEFTESNMLFLLEMSKIDEAEEYLLARAGKLNGELYPTLLPLAEAMNVNKRYLATSLIYRSLLLAILKRGYTKAYPHGVRYLKILDLLAISLSDWKKFPDHEAFKKSIASRHGKKRSFWSKYNVDLSVC